MRKIIWAALLLGFSTALRAADAPASPNINRAKLEEYIRYAEGFTPGVKMTLGDLAKTASPQLWALPVHMALGDQVLDRTYYITADGQEIAGGKLWYLSQSPFSEVVKQLPTGGPSFGPADAKITIVVFSDFQCPFCRQFAQTLRQEIPKTYPTQVRVVFANFPLQSLHPWAFAMAEAASCVYDGDNERFWTLHDWVFEHQGEIKVENLRDKILGYAKDHNLDTAKITACVDTHATKPAVEQSIQIGKHLGLDQTPVVFVNGRMLGGAQKWDTLDAVIKLDLQRDQGNSDTGARKNQ